ncbi:hypothetical protein PH189_01555 [Actinomycetospora chibensis]|nr:hypothetical protein [Actinomycetospora chibensis]MDD7922244.1 hypothetical protein [Actinomycetospora chibensis]
MDEVDTRVVGDAEGTLIAGRYRLGGLRDADGRRRVHHGWDTRLRRAVAVLLVDRDTSHSAAGPAATEPTLPVTPAHLHRPGLVELYDGGVHGREVFLVCQLVPGPTLATRLEERLDPTELAGLVSRAAEALGPVHRHGAAHGALTPDRVLLGGARPMIAECGLAELVERWSGLPGDAAYRAPEQDGGPARPSSDVYALGRMLLEARLRSPWGREARAVRAMARGMTAHDPRVRPTIDEVAVGLASCRDGVRPTPHGAATTARLVRGAAIAVAAGAVVLGATTAAAFDHAPADGASATLAPREQDPPAAAAPSPGRPTGREPTVLTGGVSPVASAATHRDHDPGRPPATTAWTPGPDTTEHTTEHTTERTTPTSAPTSTPPTASRTPTPTRASSTSPEPTSSEPTSSEPTSSEPISSEPTSSEPTSSETTVPDSGTTGPGDGTDVVTGTRGSR